MGNLTFRAMVVSETEDKKYTREIKEKTIADLPAGEVRIPRHPASDSTRRRPRIPRDPGRLFQ